MAFLFVELEYRHVCSSANDEKREEDCRDGHIDADLRSSSELPYLRLVRSAIVLYLLNLRHIDGCR